MGRRSGGKARRSASGGLDNPGDLIRFRQALLGWYEGNKRDLPWRRDRDPWRVLVSEVMLQQTTVATVARRYDEFLARFPSPSDLARTSAEEVLAAWSGLGYYSRARRLRQAAIQLAERGDWPETARELSELPGFGPYTAAAVASIAFGEPVVAADTNVRRVTARLMADPNSEGSGFRPSEIDRKAERLLDRRNPGDFNQAMMELGALVCLPDAPECEVCPAAQWCEAFRRGVVDGVAVKSGRPTTELRHDLALAVLRVIDGRPHVLAWRRPSQGLYAGMSEFPTWREGKTLPSGPEAMPSRLSSADRRSAIDWVSERLGLSSSELEASGDSLGQIRHGITRYKVTLELLPARFVDERTDSIPLHRADPDAPGGLAGEDSFRPFWIPLDSDWVPTATPQRRLMRILRSSLPGLGPSSSRELRESDLFRGAELRRCFDREDADGPRDAP